MNTALKIVMSAALCAAVGCAAETGAPQEGANVRSTEQAATLATALNTGDDLSFPGIARLGTTDKWISIGGYTVPGAATTRSSIFDANLGTSPEKRYQVLSNQLPVALGEASIRLLEHTGSAPNDHYVFLVAGGRHSRDTAAVTDTYILDLSGTDFQTATWTTVNVAGGGQELRTGVVIGHDDIKQCGTSATLQLAAGGMTDKGMDITTGMTATDVIQVFTYVSANKATSHWDYLLDGSNNQVKLSVARGYKETYGFATTDIRVFGGANGTTNRALSSVDKILVSSSCVANGNLGTPSGGVVKVLAINNMPAARARMDSIVKDFTISNTTYKLAIAGGNDNTGSPGYAAPTAVFYYDPVNDAYDNTTASLATGRLFPLFSDDTNQVQLVVGVAPTTANTNHLTNATVTDVDKLSTANGTRAAGAALTKDRVGSLVTHVYTGTGKGYAVNGHVYSGGTPSSPATVQNAEQF